MKLSQALDKFHTVFSCGPIETRLRFECGIKQPAWELMGTPAEAALKRIFAQDIQAAQAANVPILLPATTFRASRHHLPATVSVEEVNLASLKFVTTLQKELDSPTNHSIITSAAIGSMYNAYSADKIPTMAEAALYHQEQVRILSTSNIDLINAATMPSFNEAIGVALALMHNTDKEYSVGFILNEEGLLLDGTSLGDAIKKIDEATAIQPPLGYMVYCTHPSILQKLDPTMIPPFRLLGIRGNASTLSLSARDQLTSAVGGEPELFAHLLMQLKKKFGLRILGGCCGTSVEHLKAIIKSQQELKEGVLPCRSAQRPKK